MSSRSTRAAHIIFIVSSATPTSAWCSRRSSKSLFSPAIMDAKAAQEKSFRQQIGDRADAGDIRAAYDHLAEAAQAQAKLYRDYRLLEGGHAFMSDSYHLARELLRAGDERPKPNGE